MLVEAGDSPYDLTELIHFSESLPPGFVRGLQLGRNGIAVDFTNNFLPVFLASEEQEKEGVRADHWNYVIQGMRSYRDYLRSKIRQYNEGFDDPFVLQFKESLGMTVRIDEAPVVEKFMSVPVVLDIEAKIGEMKRITLQPGPDFHAAFVRLQQLAREAILLVREEI